MEKETDTVGLPKRYKGQRFILNGRPFVILKNLGLTVLCPCPDMLEVQYLDTQEITHIENQPFDIVG